MIASLELLSDSGRLPSYYQESASEILDHLDRKMPCPPFRQNSWDGCVCWFKDSAKEWISIFREINSILENSDFEVATLVTDRPGMIVYEDEIQVVAKSRMY